MFPPIQSVRIYMYIYTAENQLDFFSSNKSLGKSLNINQPFSLNRKQMTYSVSSSLVYTYIRTDFPPFLLLATDLIFLLSLLFLRPASTELTARGIFAVRWPRIIRNVNISKELLILIDRSNNKRKID